MARGAAVAAAILAAVAASALLRPDASVPEEGVHLAAQPASPEGPGPGRMVWSGCSGWRSSTQFPRGTSPGSPPPGWNPSAGELSSVDLAGFLCTRVAVGPFERGPVRVVLEMHGNAGVPEACRAGLRDTERPTVLAAFLTDDAEVAAELRRSYGLPARIALIEDASNPVAVAESHRWSWAEGLGAASWIDVLAETASAPLPVSWHARIFWPQGEGVGSLDLLVAGNRTFGDSPVTGHFEPPMLMAAVAAGEYVGPGTWMPDLEASGTFAQYADLQCGAAA